MATAKKPTPKKRNTKNARKRKLIIDNNNRILKELKSKFEK
jgi:hypothetical protein